MKTLNLNGMSIPAHFWAECHVCGYIRFDKGHGKKCPDCHASLGGSLGIRLKNFLEDRICPKTNFRSLLDPGPLLKDDSSFIFSGPNSISGAPSKLSGKLDIALVKAKVLEFYGSERAGVSAAKGENFDELLEAMEEREARLDAAAEDD
ncbi:hypothetical protein LCGC14_0318560 [marine sediment metagenome]|uniref:Uncharacterized protein n=1 Tax=marine sediment metagenome TaxID=412755 RepID=A0A0F9WS30_9ZZZZ